MTGGTGPCHRMGRARLITVLAGLSAASPLATDMYVPGLPEMTRSLHTDTAAVQLSITGFLLGIIAGQLLWGPLSDATGRRPVLVTGTSAFAVCSLACAFAPTVEVLNAARVGQGFTGAAGIVVARAVVSDLYDDDRQLGRVFGTLGAVTALGPVLAPLLGGALLTVTSWRSVFVVLSLAGLLLTLGVVRWLPESRPRRTAAVRTLPGLAASLRTLTLLARRRSVLAPVLAIGFCSAAVFAYIAGTTFLFQDVYGRSAAFCSLVYGVNALGNMAGSLAYGRLADRWSAETLLTASAAAGLAGPTLLALVHVTADGAYPDEGGQLLAWACLFTTVTAFGVFFPAVTTVTQSRGRHAPGAASALLGCTQFAFGAAAAPLAGLFGTRTPLPTAAILTACMAGALLSAVAAAGAGSAGRPGVGRKTSKRPATSKNCEADGAG